MRRIDAGKDIPDSLISGAEKFKPVPEGLLVGCRGTRVCEVCNFIIGAESAEPFFYAAHQFSIWQNGIGPSAIILKATARIGQRRQLV